MDSAVHQPSSIDFDFNNGRESPYLSTPSTPKRFGNANFYFSAPTSPARTSEFYQEIEEFSPASYTRGEASTSSSPFNWDERLWPYQQLKGADDFELATTKSASPRSSTELFTGGYIKPSKLGRVDELQTIKSPLLSPQTPNSKKSRRTKSFWSAFSPKRKKELDPFDVALDGEAKAEQGRGRERVSALSTSRSGRKPTRSLSPSRVSKYPWEEEDDEKLPQNPTQPDKTTKPSSSTALTLSSSSKGSRKWRLKDFFLFRSASEGRASQKDPFKKYADLYRKYQTSRSTGSKSVENSSNVPAPRRGQLSAHELHYTVNKAISQDMKKKSFLPYKQGILGRLAINPTVHALAYGYGSQPHSCG